MSIIINIIISIITIMYSAISGKQDKEKQRRDSLVVQAARQPSILSLSSSLDAVR